MKLWTPAFGLLLLLLLSVPVFADFLSSAPCICGDSCGCDKGACPGKCPVAE